ncbi:hypothetical protein E7T09_05760 [Deinococcus sp. KSM4-11]|uniref:hypothetical protein n=1 Tax=Deinococcus sp. KSM4-11 TaxID=2568654 RepID=UPI0010A3DA0D|nr:hypothetical protein [Deinococcus sp. KSM4-11]THF88686.1 hypothetical protein E7T09_05760 [Deinococcus sp. KSM4-11]
MSDPQSGQIDSVQSLPDGGTVYTHGHRFPDNVQVVEQRHGPGGTLQSARVTWTGFAGRVLDVTATFDAQGRLVKEEGYRAPDMTTPVLDLIRPLPRQASPQTVAPTPPQPNTGEPSAHPIAEGLHRIYPTAQNDPPDGSDS